MKTVRTTCAGFTLIEMVIVLGIIGILMALLLPALVAARQEARRSRCIGNLHDMGVAMEHYAADSNGLIPNSLAANAQPRPRLPDLMPAAWAGEGAPPPSRFAAYCGNGDLFICPEQQGHPEMSYGLSGPVVKYARVFRKIANPVRTPLVFDTLQPLGFYYSDLDYRHLGSANILYADSHVETRWARDLSSFEQARRLPGPVYLELRLAGNHWQHLGSRLLVNDNEILSVEYDRTPGNPDEQLIDIGVVPINLTDKRSTIFLSATGLGGGVPVWLRVSGGEWHKIATLSQARPADTVDITPLVE